MCEVCDKGRGDSVCVCEKAFLLAGDAQLRELGMYKDVKMSLKHHNKDGFWEFVSNTPKVFQRKKHKLPRLRWHAKKKTFDKAKELDVEDRNGTQHRVEVVHVDDLKMRPVCSRAGHIMAPMHSYAVKGANYLQALEDRQNHALPRGYEGLPKVPGRHLATTRFRRVSDV